MLHGDEVDIVERGTETGDIAGVDRVVAAWGLKVCAGDSDVKPETVEGGGGSVADVALELFTQLLEHRLNGVAVRVTYTPWRQDTSCEDMCLLR